MPDQSLILTEVLGIFPVDGDEPPTHHYQDRLAAHRAALIAAEVDVLKRSYTTPDERADEVARLSLTHPLAYESAAARASLLARLYDDRNALNEFLAYLCGDDLLAWAKLLQLFPTNAA